MNDSGGSDDVIQGINPPVSDLGDIKHDLRVYLSRREKSHVVEVLEVSTGRGLKRAAEVKPSTIDIRRSKRVRTDNHEERLRNREERFGTSSLRIEEKIKLLEKENSNLKLEKDFNRIYDEEMLDLHDIKIKEQMSEIHSLSKKLQEKNVIIHREKKKNEKLSKENKELQVELSRLRIEMERDFIQCQYCVEKFRTNKQMERHHRFDCKNVPQKISK